MLQTPRFIADSPGSPMGLTMAQLRLRPIVYGRAEFFGPWGFRQSRNDLLFFHSVVEGRLWLETDRGGQWMEEGDCVLLTSGVEHRLSDREGAKVARIEDLIANYSVAPQWIRYGAAGPKTVVVCGAFEPLDDWTMRTARALPAVLIQRAVERPEIAATLHLIAMEAMGADGLVMDRLTEVLFLQMLRDLSAEQLPRGWFRGMADERIARLLEALHRDASREWTVEDMAEFAGVSRSAFHDRFVEAMGTTPMDYLMEWRLSLARTLLERGGLSVGEVADRVGYRSEAAFSRNFKRRVGMTPGVVRKRLK